MNHLSIENEPEHHIGEIAQFCVSYDRDEEEIQYQFLNSGEAVTLNNIEDFTNFIHIG
jgi:hypothetical protein